MYRIPLLLLPFATLSSARPERMGARSNTNPNTCPCPAVPAYTATTTETVHEAATTLRETVTECITVTEPARTETIIHTIRESDSHSTRVAEYANDHSGTIDTEYQGKKTVTVTYGISPAATHVYHDDADRSEAQYETVTRTRQVYEAQPSSSYREDEPSYGATPGNGNDSGNGHKGHKYGTNKYPGGNNQAGEGYDGKGDSTKDHVPAYGPGSGSHESGKGSEGDKYDTTPGTGGSGGDKYHGSDKYDGDKHDGGKHDAGKYDGGKHDDGKHDAGKQEGSKYDGGKPDGGKPDYGSDKYHGANPDKGDNGHSDNGHSEKPAYENNTHYDGETDKWSEKPGDDYKHEQGSNHDDGEKYDGGDNVDENPYSNGGRETAYPAPHPQPHPSNAPGEVPPCGQHDPHKPCVITTVYGTSTEHITVYPTAAPAPASTTDCSISSKIVTKYNTVIATIHPSSGSWTAPNATQSVYVNPINGTATAVAPGAEYTSGQTYKAKRAPKAPRAAFASLLNLW
ncbi:hypothetical protein ACHAQH_004418 [Verticillium albo-atrum]